MRIVSLLPSATEMVCALGLREQLVGVTHECDFPASVTSLPRVTRTLIPPDASSAQIDALVRERVKNRTALYQLDVPMLQELQPDLIITQALCDVCAVDETEVREAACAMPGSPRVINLEPMSLGDVLDSMLIVAREAKVLEQGSLIVEARWQRVRAVSDRAKSLPAHPTVVFLEWIDPLFCGGHWNPELVTLAGGRELIGKPGARSRTITWDELRGTDPDVLVIACCGFTASRARQDLPLLERKPAWTNLNAVKNGRVHVVDGSAYFNRPGPRLVDSLELLASILHP